MKKYLYVAALVMASILTSPATAQDEWLGTGDTDQSYLSLSVGIWDVWDNEDDATNLRAEYRHGDSLFWEIKPWLGAEVTTDGSLWGGGGLLADFNLTPNIYVVPSVGVGLYAQGGSDLDLGHPIEFRTQLEGGYQFMNNHRLGVAIGHTSNWGMDDDNPGAGTMNVYYNIPINSMF